MKPQLSKDFSKNFWSKFDAEFSQRKSFNLKILVPTAAIIFICTLAIIRNQQTSNFDPLAVQIAIEVDESYSGIFEDQFFEDDASSWLAPESII